MLTYIERFLHQAMVKICKNTGASESARFGMTVADAVRQQSRGTVKPPHLR